MRYERKYSIEDSSYDRVLHAVMSNPVSFVEAYPDRQVNSIYYDDINYSAYNDNLLGISNREKYRVRWYGLSTQIAKPILEKKIKSNMLGSKAFTALSSFDLSKGAPLINGTIHHDISELYPWVLVRYQRTYLESMDGLLRATIDQDLQYVNVVDYQLTNELRNDPAIILEIKYDKGQEAVAESCLQSIPYRVTKNSKYVSAMGSFLL